MVAYQYYVIQVHWVGSKPHPYAKATGRKWSLYLGSPKGQRTWVVNMIMDKLTERYEKAQGMSIDPCQT